MIRIMQGNAVEEAIKLAKSFTNDPDHIVVLAHGCNNRGVMKRGIAKEIALKLPQGVTEYHAQKELPGGSLYVTLDAATNVYVANIITQTLYTTDPAVNYKWVHEGFNSLQDYLNRACSDGGADCHLYLPRIGAGLGGGSWSIVENMIIEHFDWPGLETTIWCN